MNKEQSSIFRLSAVIYANDNYEISPLQVHKKVIEDAFLHIDNSSGLSVETIAEYIEQEHLLTFTTEEIETVLKNNHFAKDFVKVSGTQQDLYHLARERRTLLEAGELKTLDDYIAEYVSINNLEKGIDDVIYKYLYGIFSTNVDGFCRLVKAGKVKELSSHFTPNENESEVINGFLNWDNDDKNKAIFKLSSYALEYCMLTGKKEANVKLEQLQHKIFYLDTNILYRAIGVDGDDRKKRTISFLQKLREHKNEIRITKLSKVEFEQSLKGYIKRLKKSETPSIQSQVYTEYVSYDNIFKMYHTWAFGRHNATVDTFENVLLAEYQEFIEKNGITVDGLITYSVDKHEEDLKDMGARIMGMSSNKQYEAAYTDAQNILWIKYMRKPGEETVFSTKTFLLSSDRSFYTWDSKYYSHNTPIVLLPSQWLSLLLRYGARTSDDYKSFVSFLNIQSKEGVLSGEQIHLILAGIGEVTTNIQQQSRLLDIIIEKDFKEGVKGKSNRQIQAIAKNSAERELQSVVEELQEKTSDMSERLNLVTTQLEDQKKDSEARLALADSKIKDLEGQVGNLTKLNNASLSHDQLRGIWEREMNNRAAGRKRYENDVIKKWKRHSVYYGIFGLLFLFAVSGWAIYAYFVYTPEINSEIDRILAYRPISLVASIVLAGINVFTIMHMYNCLNNPAYEKNKRGLIEFPDELKDVPFEAYIKV